MSEYVVTLQRVVECDAEAEAIELAIEEINGCGGLEALDFEVASLDPKWTVCDNVTGQTVSKSFDYSKHAVEICAAMNLSAGPGGRYGVYRGTERYFG